MRLINYYFETIMRTVLGRLTFFIIHQNYNHIIKWSSEQENNF